MAVYGVSGMYLYLELWTAKDAWFSLTVDQRQAKIDSMLRDAKKHPITAVIPFSFRALGDAVIFDGVTAQTVVVDPAVARPMRFHYASAWTIPTRELIKPFEDRFRNLGWWFDYFEQENAWGEMNALATQSDMIQGNATARSTEFEGSSAGEERNDYCWCPPGPFKMGFEGTNVTLTQGFWMAKYEVTQELYGSVMDDNPSAFAGDLLPVDSVSREKCLQFCVKLNRRERLAGRLPDGWEYNLPTEAQWEYAARAGTTTVFPWGDDESQAGEYSWHMLNSGSASHIVGQKKSNTWGLYDMLGNCLERCRDVWVDPYPGGTDPDVKVDDVTVRTDESDGRWGVCRGGGWFIPPSITPKDRTRLGPGNQGYLLGFRLAIVRATSDAPSAVQQSLLEWGNATMGHWVTNPGPVEPVPSGAQGIPFEGSSSARWLRGENALEGQFVFGGLKGNFVTTLDRASDQIMQHTVNTDGGSGQTVISKHATNQWFGREDAFYPDGSHASSIDIVTLSDGGETMEHHITNRARDGEALPDIRFALHRVND
jgi:formylglycine-generating enzyme required for sulfatase activity